MSLIFRTENYFVDTQPAPIPVADKKDMNMFDDDYDLDDDHKQDNTSAKLHIETRDWFLRELDQLHEIQMDKATEEYITGKAPATLKEAIDRIQAGNFSAKPGYSWQDYSPHAFAHAIRWSSAPADHESFEKARNKICDAYQKAKRQIMAAMEYAGNLPAVLNKFEDVHWKVPLQLAPTVTA